jgi:hypothetical protein
MAHLALAAFTDATAWTATAAGGGASALVTVTAAAGHRPGVPGIRVTVDGGAVGDRLERALPAADLDDLDDLQVRLRSDRVASPEGGFGLELALGSAALAVDAGGNTWRRLLPVSTTRRWETVVATVTDLPPAVRSAVSRVRLTVVTDEPCTVDLSGLGALRYDLLGDVEAALVARLDELVELDGDPVRAVVAPDAPPGGAGAAHLRIRPLAVRPAPERDRTAEVRTDFTPTGFALRPPPQAVDLDYAVDVVAGDRAGQRALVEAIVEQVAPVDTLLVLDRPHTLEWAGPLGVAGDPPIPSALLRVSAARRPTAAPAPAVPPFNSVNVEVEHGA